MNEHSTQSADMKVAQGLQTWLVARLAERRGLDPSAIDVRESWSHYGLDSLGATALLSELGKMLGRSLPVTMLWEHPTVEALTRHLVEGASRPPERAVEAAVGSPVVGEPIAIVGMACRFPGGAEDPAAFWRLLLEGRDAVTEVPRERWDVDQFYDPDPASPGKMSSRWGGFLHQVDGFEPSFFGISPSEAIEMDPQQRLLLEVSWEALEDAGLRPSALQCSATGVYAGVIVNDYERFQAELGLAAANHYGPTGANQSIVANRISYVLGLQGPSMSINTACSSSLVAVHLACQALRDGECELALAAGVQLMLHPYWTVAVAKTGALAPDGRCRTFDASAQGYVRGEGAGTVVLKPLSRARRDGDRIYAVIRGSALNNDGASNGLTAPNPQAQVKVLQAACRRAGVEPASVQYVELHGTGTPLGDPIEAGALGAVYGAARPPERPLWVGSVKTNIGHLEGAAGIAGLIKATLSLHHRILPPSLHFETPNPHIDFVAQRLQVVTKPLTWPLIEGEVPRAGVSSFGFGGTNAHVILEGIEPPGAWQFLPLAAESESLLKDRVAALHSWAESVPGLTLDQIAGAVTRYPQGKHRLAALASSPATLLASLRRWEAGGAVELIYRQAAAVQERPVFVYTGFGSEWPGMGLKLWESEPTFRAALRECDEALQAQAGWSLLDELLAPPGRERFTDAHTHLLFPVLIAQQIALTALWRSWGIEPVAVIGHSIGEVAAAQAAGIFDVPTALHIVHELGKMYHADYEDGRGLLAAVLCDPRELETELARHPDELFITGDNGAGSCVVCGNGNVVRGLLESLAARNIGGRPLGRTWAHSPRFLPFAEGLSGSLAALMPRPARVPMFSTTLARPVAGPELDAAYWQRHTTTKVSFAAGIEHFAREQHACFVEVGVHAILSRAIRNILDQCGSQAEVLPTQRRDEDGQRTALATLGRLFARGANVRWTQLLPDARGVPDAPGKSEMQRDPEAVGPQATLPGTEALPKPAPLAEGLEPLQMLPLSARNPAALLALTETYRQFLSTEAGGGTRQLADIAYTASLGRDHQEHRLAVVGRSAVEWVEALRAAQTSLREKLTQPKGAERLKVAFVYSGYGAHWVGMGRQLLREEPIFRAAIEACDEAIQREAGWSVMAELHQEDGAIRYEQADVIQPLLFAMAVALTALWRSWGVEPHAVVGHSMGEIAASYVAGALSLAEAVHLICQRSLLLGRLFGHGLMVLVELPYDDAERLCQGRKDRLSAAVSNSPGSTVLSGDHEVIDDVLATLEARGIGWRRLKWALGAGHSPQVDALLPELEATLSGLQPRPGSTAIYSTVTANAIEAESLGTSYWLRNLREPVKFSQTVRRMRDQGFNLFVEISPHPILVTPIEEIIGQAGRGCAAVPSLRRDKEERRCLLESLASLYAQGVTPDWRRLSSAGGRRVSLPHYPWQRRRYWVEQRELKLESLGPVRRSNGAKECSRIEAEGLNPTDEWLKAVRSRQQDQSPPFPAQLKAYLGEQIAAVLALPLEEIPSDLSLRSLGMDSLSAGRLRSRINAALGLSLSLTSMWKVPTLEALTDQVLRALETPAAARDDAKIPAAGSPVRPAPASRTAGERGRALVAFRRDEAIKLRLFCFPYMGGGADVYADWRDQLPGGVDLWAFQPAGRHERYDEPAHSRIADLIDELSLSIRPLLDRPFAFYGHSFGATVAYELVRRLRQEGLSLPFHLFFGAAPAPHISATAKLGLAELDDRAILSLLDSLGGVPEEILQDPEASKELLRSLRGDFLMLDSYTHLPAPPLPCPISVYGGQDDPVVRSDGLDGWQEYTSANWSRKMLPGGHLFLLSHQDELLRSIIETLSSFTKTIVHVLEDGRSGAA